MTAEGSSRSIQAHPMDICRTGASLLGCLEPEGNGNDQDAIFERLMASYGSMLMSPEP